MSRRVHGATPRRKLADLATGLSAAVVIFVAVPAVLWVAVGAPAPGRWGRPHDSSPFLFDVLGAIAWIAWLNCCWPLLGSVVERVRRGDTGAAEGTRVIDRLAARIAAAVLVIVPLTLALGTEAGAASPDRGRSATAAVAAAVAPREGTAAPATDAGEPARYVVEPDDTLWGIAQLIYGDGGEWQAIAKLNLGRLMLDGRRFVDPSVICPGWVLTLPVDTADPVAATRPVALTTSGPAASIPSTGSRPAIRSVSAAAPGASAAAPGADRRAAGRGPSRSRHRGAAPAPSGPPLAELVALGIGVIGASALARRARRHRRSAGVGGDPLLGDSDDAVDLATLIGHFEDAPVLDWFELANRHLSASLASMPAWTSPPPVRLFRIGADGVDAWLSARAGWCPDLWELRDEGRTWHLSSRHDPDDLAEACRSHQPMYPAVVPVGDDGAGTWLAVVEPGCCLPVIGAEAGALVATMRLAAESWAWSDRLTVTIDPATAEREAALHGSSGSGTAGDHPRILFIGDPSLLTSRARARCGAVTTLPLPATDLTVAVDARAASIHPLGLTLRAHVLRLSPRGPAQELLGSPTEIGAPLPSEPPGGPFGRRSTVPLARRVPASSAWEASGASDSPGSLGPGPVEVRLLVPVPRVEGLQDELPPKRVRRATELIAYLALQHPAPVTSDRLRTRVLGSADSDAAAKTLFNVATAARRALGTDPSGEPYLPCALKTGHYRISDLVTVDVDRAATFVAAAKDAGDGEEALALYRAALELVEGEPLSGALSGYAWWQAEGHAGRTRDLLVGAACEVARLAADARLDELAEWALERARVLDPYSESVSRAAMRWAASRGNVDRLRREWIDCRRMVDDLDPGSVPSERTGRLYAELSRQVCASPGAEAPGRGQASLAAIDAAPRSTVPSAPSAP
ncbi:MAG TPA: hypothetical protein VMU76_06080 [Acidimicrobiales bacterium]|nr:hypothetical protein [Acidimicrobiales bacterium]